MDRESLSAVKEQSGMKQRIAVVGTGIAGMSAAWWLHQDHDITVFEAEQRIGGHTNTAFIQEGEKTVPVDTGFIVCNEQNYPLLMKLFRHLDVPLKPTSMSFSVRHLADDLEYCGSSLELLFVQRRNLFPGVICDFSDRCSVLMKNVRRCCKIKACMISVLQNMQQVKGWEGIFCTGTYCQ